jgi:hypothetical protein
MPTESTYEKYRGLKHVLEPNHNKLYKRVFKTLSRFFESSGPDWWFRGGLETNRGSEINFL